MISRTISHYKILEKLGEGGMGVVYKAQDTKLDRIVALKFLPKHLLCDQEAKTRFEHEAKAASALDHPNIATIYEIDEVEGECFISMAYVEGKSIKELLKVKTFSLNEVLDIGIQICEGLATAHEKGIVHRDIKSDNIMLTSRGQVKIMDFGLAKLKGVSKLTKTGSTVGTIAYMSPEQAKGEKVDHRTDIWSLGIVLYELLSGELPFKSEYEQAVIYSILNEDPKPVSELNKEVPESFNTIVKKTLEKEPAQRYQNMGEILKDLQAVRNGFAVVKRPRIKRKMSQAILFSLALVLALILIVWLVPHKGKQIPKKISIGVMFFDNQTGEDKYNYLRKALADLLITGLSQSTHLQVVTFPRMFLLLKTLGHENLESIDPSLGFELCEAAGAQVMVLGSLTKSGEVFGINTQMLDVASKKQIGAFRVIDKGEDSILGHLLDDLTDKIKRGLELSARETQKEKKDITVLTTASLEAYRYYSLGKEAAIRMYNREAIENFERALSLDSTFVEAYDALARQYYTIGQPSKALELIKKGKAIATSSSKGTEETLFGMLALEALLVEEWDMAINYLKRVITINPENIGAHGDLGYVYYRWKRMYDEGISEFKKVLELDPQGIASYGSFTYNLLGWAYFRKGDLEKADAAFKKYVALVPDQAYPLNVLAEFYLSIGNYDQTLTDLKRSYHINPDYLSTSALFGDTYLAKGMYNQAESCYRRYLVLSRDEVEKGDAYFSLGKLYYLKNEYEESTQECEQALKLNPQMIEALWIQGLIFVKKGRLEQAESLMMSIKGLIEKTKDEDLRIYYYHLSGELLFNKGLYEQAFQNLNQAVLISCLDRTFFINALGEAYLSRGELNKAVEKLEEAFQINSHCAQTHYLMGLAYEKQNKKAKAKACFQKFMEIWEEADKDLPQLIEVKRKLLRL